MKTHELRSWSYLYQEMKAGRKTHDLRKNDRNFHVGDMVVLKEYNQLTDTYSGDECTFVITYITGRDATPCAVSTAVLDPDYVILSLRKL